MTKEELARIDDLCTKLGIETWMKNPDQEEIKKLLGKLSKIYIMKYAYPKEQKIISN